MQRVHAWAARHPPVVDAGLAALVAALVIPANATEFGVTGAGWVWFAAVHIPLVWRRRAPVVVFWGTFGLVWGSDLIGFSAALWGITLVALYTVARHRPQRYVWPAVAAIVLTAVVVTLAGDEPWSTLATVAAVVAATALLGIAVRTRRAYLAERDRRLEQERDQQVRLAVASERARIAREMHDIVAHHLAVMVALADGAGYAAAASPERAADAMQQVSATGREALSETRRLVGLLRDGELTDADGRTPPPGLADLDRLMEQVRAAGLRVAVTREGVPGDWGPGAGLAVYRIVQEALTNTLKHAGPRASARVRLAYTLTGVDVEIADDGAGHPARPRPENGEGHGLAGMAQRAAAYRGEVAAGPTAGVGWRVRAHLQFDSGSAP